MARKLQNHKTSGLFSALLKNMKMTKQIICVKKNQNPKLFGLGISLPSFNLKLFFMATL